MAFNIANIFRNTQQVAVPQSANAGTVQGAPAQQAQPNQQNPMQRAPVIPGSGMPQPNPAAGGEGTAPQAGDPGTGGENSPLDGWKTMWDTPPADKAPTDPWSQPILSADPVKITEAASKMNMMQGVPQELVQKVIAGNDPQSLMDLINRVAQNTLAMSAQLSSASVERAGTVIRERTEKTLPSKMRDFQLDNLPVESPVLSHPAAQGMLQMTRQQLKMKNPQWSAQQINEEAVRYLTGFAQAVTSQEDTQQQRRNPVGAGETDWNSFLDS
jgi:hypothetical protein